MSHVAPFIRPLLVVSHPGHEVGVYGFLGRHRPPVMAWTDGSGRTKWPRTQAARALVTDAGAEPVEPFGAVPDADLFRALLDHDAGPFVAWFEAVAHVITATHVSDVVTEAAEGFSPLADAQRWIVAAAAAAVGSRVRVWEWPAVGAPVSVVPMGGEAFDLTDFEFDRKLHAAHASVDLAPEVDEAIRRHGMNRFRREVLTPALPWGPPADPLTPPGYERRGEQLAAAGQVRAAIRYAEHVRPALRAVEAKMGGRGRSAAA